MAPTIRLYPKARTSCLFYLVAAVLLSGCMTAGNGNRFPASVPVKKPVLRVSISGMITPKQTFNQYHKLLAYLAKKSDRRYVLVQRKTYQEVNDLVRAQQVDLAFICSGAYLPAKRGSNAEMLVVPIVRGKAEYYSYIIVNSNSGITEFSQLKDKRFAFTDPLSNTGKLYPTYLLKTMGYTPDTYFSSTIFTYNHDNSIKAVQQKVVDGAAVDSLIFDYFSARSPQTTKNINIIQTSPPFGIPPVIVNKNIDGDLKAQLKAIFLGMADDKEGRAILKGLLIDSFTIGDDAAYQSIGQMEEAVK